MRAIENKVKAIDIPITNLVIIKFYTYCLRFRAFPFGICFLKYRDVKKAEVRKATDIKSWIIGK